MAHFISTLPSGQQLLHIENEKSKGVISLFGAQILSWIPTDETEVLFMSNKALFDNVSAIRGGIPICWPWFGNRENNSAHGFARNLIWELSAVIEEPNATIVEMVLSHNVEEYKDLNLTIKFLISDILHVSLVTHNQSNSIHTFTEALHTYLNVKNISFIKVKGLENNEYFDKVNNVSGISSEGEITIDREFDRIFKSTESHKVIDENRILLIEKSGSKNTVVWNPWIEKSKSIIDLDDNDYKEFICVEAANITNPIVLKPFEKHELTQRISLATS